MGLLRGVTRSDEHSVQVVLYTGPDCHLCRVAQGLLLSLQRTIPFRTQVRPIEGDEELERRFLLEVPVIEVDGEIVSRGQTDLDAVRSAVNSARMARSRRQATGDL